LTARQAIFAGSFDPIHRGHVDLVERATRLFDRVYVAVLRNTAKQSLFTVEERVGVLERLFVGNQAVRVEAFSGLLVDYARKCGASTILRGLRSGSDLDYEAPMAGMNRRMLNEIETVFLLPRPELADISSTLVREIWKLGGRCPEAVPELVALELDRKVAGK
jgi:pantetheine-phosphate adenylyltransferase